MKTYALVLYQALNSHLLIQAHTLYNAERFAEALLGIEENDLSSRGHIFEVGGMSTTEEKYLYPKDGDQLFSFQPYLEYFSDIEQVWIPSGILSGIYRENDAMKYRYRVVESQKEIV